MRLFLKQTLPFKEFIAMMALNMSVLALSIDAVLPALASMGQALGVVNANDNQMLIGALFVGMAFGQLLFGPLSDSIGRRRSMLAGYAVFFLGSLLSLLAIDFSHMLLGRLLQGFGLAAPRVLSITIIRDLYQGRAMARVVSFVMMIFILVPMVAPIFGQVILNAASWEAIFVAIGWIGFTAFIWYWLRQGETLAAEDQADFTLHRTITALRLIFSNRVSVGYTLAAGLVTGPFIFYLSSAQQMFQDAYALHQWFPLYFAGLAFAIGLSSFLNGRHVMRLGMHRIVRFALTVLGLVSSIFMVVAWWSQGLPALWAMTIYMFLSFFCIGLVFGNINAMAMEPLGHIAGIGSAFVGSVSTLLAALLAFGIGQQFNGTVYPLVGSFLAAALITLMLMRWIEKGAPSR